MLHVLEPCPIGLSDVRMARKLTHSTGLEGPSTFHSAGKFLFIFSRGNYFLPKTKSEAQSLKQLLGESEGLLCLKMVTK